MTLTILPWLIPTIFSVFAFGFASSVLWYKHKAAKARTAMMQALAQTLGLTFQEKDTFGLVQQLKGFDLFQRERSRWLGKGKVVNVMRGWVDQTDVYLFDYIYTVQAGNSRKQVAQTVFFANEKTWSLSKFHLRPENWWHKLKAKIGLDSDINFEENPEFSEKYWLEGELEELVRQQFTPALQGFLAERPPAHLEGNNYYLLAYKPRKKMDDREARVFFKHCCEIVRFLKEKGGVELLDLAEMRKEGVAGQKHEY